MSIQNPNPDPYEQGSTTAPGASSAYEPVAYDAAGTPPPPGYIPPPGYDPAAPGYDPAAPGYVPAPGMPGAPNPMLAALLGFIPGVGAMYNGQFAKGIAHIAIFAVFSSLAKHVNDFFGLFVFGWICYMVFEAYQTANARRHGLPLPDPFGLNNIGERFGFHHQPDMSQFWAGGGPGGPGAVPPPPPPTSKEWHVSADGGAYYSRTDASGAQRTYSVDPSGNVSSSSTAAGVPPPPPPPGYGAGYGAGYDPNYGVNYGVNPGAPGYTAPGMPPVPPYAAPPIPPYGMPPVRQGGLPTGAIWLIGLGAFALLGSLHSFAFLEGEVTGGLFLIGLAVFMFWRRSYNTAGMFPEGSAAARWNLIRASRGAGVLFIVGLLTMLQGLHVIAWENSWPFLLIFLGLSMLVQRNASSNLGAMPYPQPVPPAAPVAEPYAAQTTAETEHSTSIVPRYTRPSNDLDAPHHEDHEEGR